MDKYSEVINRDIYQKCYLVEPERVTEDSDYVDFFDLGKMHPTILPVEITFDHFLDCIDTDACNNPEYLQHIKIYDEAIVETREEAMLRYQMIKYLNKIPNAIFSFYLSDSSMRAYITFMNELGWKWEDKTKLVLNLDRNLASTSNIPLHLAKGKIDIDPEKLACYSSRVLRLLPGKVDETVLSDAKKLKVFTENFIEKVDNRYKLSSMTAFDKAFVTFHYLFDDKRSGLIAFTPLDIQYADERVRYSKKGARLRPSATHWESRAAGTLENGKGVCSGQAKLLRALLSNPEMKVSTDNIYGKTSSGGIHCWCGSIIDDKLYQTCTTGKILFGNLDSRGYVPFDYQYMPEVYEHASLTNSQLHQVERHVKSLRR